MEFFLDDCSTLARALVPQSSSRPPRGFVQFQKVVNPGQVAKPLDSSTTTENVRLPVASTAMHIKTVAAVGLLLGVVVGVRSEARSRRLQTQDITCSADLNADGLVGVDDLLAMLATFGRTTTGCDVPRGTDPLQSDFRLPGKFTHVNNSLETEPRCAKAFVVLARTPFNQLLVEQGGSTLSRGVSCGWDVRVASGLRHFNRYQ